MSSLLNMIPILSMIPTIGEFSLRGVTADPLAPYCRSTFDGEVHACLHVLEVAGPVMLQALNATAP
jgi:hypothetical protein